MKTLIKSFLAAGMILLPGLSLTALGANIITLTGNTSYSLSSNDVAEVIAVTGQTEGSGRYFSLNGNTVFVTAQPGSGATSLISMLPMTISGPATIQKQTGSGWSGFVTIRIRTKTEYLASLTPTTAISSTSVVIPEDAAGPVNIVLESSTDMVTWTAATPGTYGSSAAKRFFRVRAIAN